MYIQIATLNIYLFSNMFHNENNLYVGLSKYILKASASEKKLFIKITVKDVFQCIINYFIQNMHVKLKL